MSKFYSKHSNLCRNCSLIKYWKRPRMKQNPKGIETGLARKLLQTVFHWKMPDHKERRDPWKSINLDKVTAREISCQLACRAPRSTFLQVSDGWCSPSWGPGQAAGSCCCSRPVSSPALEATRSFRAVEVKCHSHLSVKLNDRFPLCKWHTHVCLVFSPFSDFCFFNLRIPSTGVSGLPYEKGEANSSWKLTTTTYRKGLPIQKST